jgi:LPXTG-site transpeptidase (sortase) family protein
MSFEGFTSIFSGKTGAVAPVFRRVWRRTGPRKLLGIVLILIGVVGLAMPFLSYLIAAPEDVTLAGQQSTGGGDAYAGSNRLLIPEVGISMPIFTGDTYTSLDMGAWLTGSQPGQKGNTVIFGHRFKYLPPMSNTMFRLDGLEIGDVFTVRWVDVEHHYRVTEKRVILPTEVSVAGDFGDERITLITCTPVWSTSHRLVVVGIPIE